MSSSKLKVMFSKKKPSPETCAGPSVCECTKLSWWQEFQHKVKTDLSEVKVVVFICDRITIPCIFICPCKCHQSMAETEEPTSPTTTEQKTTIGN
jgi:hypothetical protein